MSTNKTMAQNMQQLGFQHHSLAFGSIPIYRKLAPANVAIYVHALRDGRFSVEYNNSNGIRSHSIVETLEEMKESTDSYISRNR